MKVTYQPLWRRLGEMGLERQALMVIAGITRAELASLEDDANISLDIILKITAALNSDLSDIAEIEGSFSEDGLSGSWAMID